MDENFHAMKTEKFLELGNLGTVGAVWYLETTWVPPAFCFVWGALSTCSSWKKHLCVIVRAFIGVFILMIFLLF